MTSRIPTRTNTDDRYFSDTFQAMPLEGYTKMFERMLDHPLIEVRTGVDFARAQGPRARNRRSHHLHRADRRIFRFPLRQAAVPVSLKFDHQTLEQERFQPVAVVNYPERGRALHADQRVQASDRASSRR